MKTNHLNYSIIIEKDQETGSNKPVYTAYCPSLSLADDGKTVDEALKNIKATIEFHLERLSAEGETVTLQKRQPIFTNIQVKVPKKLSLSA